MKNGKRLVVLAVFFFLSAGLSPAQAYMAGFYEDVFAFGDSLSDAGNVPGAPLTNGPVWVEYLADHFEANLYNFAQAGAVTGDTLMPPALPFNILDQVDTFVDLTNQFPTLFPSRSPQSLYTYWGGPNDLFGITDPLQAGVVIENAVKNTITALTRLDDAGAQNILIPNIPDLGLTPRFLALGSDGSDGATQIASLYNSALEDKLDAFKASYSGNLYAFDVFSFFQEVAADPALYGFTNVTDPLISNPGGDGYLFWDDVHPTTDGHRLLAAQTAVTVVPVPGAAWLLGSGLFLLTAIRKRLR